MASPNTIARQLRAGARPGGKPAFRTVPPWVIAFGIDDQGICLLSCKFTGKDEKDTAWWRVGDVASAMNIPENSLDTVVENWKSSETVRWVWREVAGTAAQGLGSAHTSTAKNEEPNGKDDTGVL